MKRLILLLLVVMSATCTVTKRTSLVSNPLVTDSAIVVCAHPLAAEVGVQVLREGGSAVDAAIAVQFALAVVYPSAGNIGGGGFMLYRSANGETTSLDYRERAPNAASTSMYLDQQGQVVPGLSESTVLASGVPGTVAGLWEAHRKYGRLEWKSLVQPAIDLAENGFKLTEKEANGLNSIQQELSANNGVKPHFLMRDQWNAGDVLRLHDLAETLIRIKDNGRAGFYEGKTADDIVTTMSLGNGLISREDLKSYQPVWREPVNGEYRGYRVISMAPPSSGGVALLQMLKMVEPYPVESWGHNTARTIHLFTEVQRRVYADRAVYLGDPDFVSVPQKEILDAAYLRLRMSSFNPQQATKSSEVKEGALSASESEQTTHLSIVDSKGNAVAVTTTLNDAYGSKIVVAGSGFLLNNEMDDFSAKPGHANMYGAIGGEANKILPGKRMLSSMTPTIVEKGGKLYMVVGTPGGTTIITSVFQTIVNVIDFKMNMQEAVAAKKVHSQWMPDQVFVEVGALTDEEKAALDSKGHTIVFRNEIGRVDAIRVRDDGKLEGGADPRGDDAGRGY